MLDSQSSPNFTSRSKALVSAVKHLIVPRETVVDLGAGREAVLCRILLQECPGCKLIAVEPFVEVSAPDLVETVRGDISALPECGADVILFNSPNSPDRFLEPEDGSYYQFAGGPNGYECLHDIIATAPSRLRDGGRLVFICPTFTLLPEMELSSLEVLAYYYEPIDQLASRAPIKGGLEAKYREFLVDRLRTQQDFWTKLGVPVRPDHVTAAVLCMRV